MVHLGGIAFLIWPVGALRAAPPPAKIEAAAKGEATVPSETAKEALAGQTENRPKAEVPPSSETKNDVPAKESTDSPSTEGSAAKTPAESIAEAPAGDENLATAGSDPPPTEISAPTSPDPDDSAAWNLYRRAAERSLAHGLAAARVLWTQLAEAYPDHPAGQGAQQILDVMTRLASVQSSAFSTELAPETNTRAARAELAIFQTANGISLGAQLCATADCDDARQWISSITVGGGIGLAVSLLATQDGIRPGQTLLIDSSTGWGSWNGLALTRVLEVESERATVGTMMAGQLLGLGVGVGLETLIDAHAGDVSLANTTGIWAGVLAQLAHGANDFDADEKWVFLTLMLASDIGLAGGAVLSQFFPMSRGRTLLIDSGGILGMLLGMAVDLLLQGADFDAMPFFGSAMAGTVAGLATSTILTRNWDAPDVPAQIGFVPLEGGGQFVLGWSF